MTVVFLAVLIIGLTAYWVLLAYLRWRRPELRIPGRDARIMLHPEGSVVATRMLEQVRAARKRAEQRTRIQGQRKMWEEALERELERRADAWRRGEPDNPTLSRKSA